MSSYFLIHSGEDGGSAEKLSKEELLNRITENYYGEDAKILNEVPEDGNMEYWGDSILIIKGEIVTPEPVELVKSYDIK